MTMLKKRLIFTLLHDNGSFMLSRNFRLQRVGDLNWLNKNYDFQKISQFIDEVIVLDVTRQKRNIHDFANVLSELTQGIFCPVSAGGGIGSVIDARLLLRSGADKVVLNSALTDNPHLVSEISQEFGAQCIIGAIDLDNLPNGMSVVTTRNGTHQIVHEPAPVVISSICNLPIGEILLNSVERDGTGQGYKFELLDFIPQSCHLPVIMAGGVGFASHLIEGLEEERIDAVATAHLFNFVGDGLKNAREEIRKRGIPLPEWDYDSLRDGKP
jgi:cyclase